MEPHTRSYEEPSEYWGAQVSETFVVEMCPRCGSEDIEEVGECLSCGHATKDIFSQFCSDCHEIFDERLKVIENLFGISRRELEEFVIEHFEW